MFVKKAEFRFIDLTPLNKPTLRDFIIDQGLVVDPNVYAKTIATIVKQASACQAETNKDGDDTHFDLEAEINDHPDSLFIKCFAIKADEANDNADYFSQEELKKSYQTFVGVPIFTNHNNTDVEAARGKVVHSWWDDERNGIMIIARIDSEAYPQLARSIKEDIIVGTSMGASRGHDLVTMHDQSHKRVDEMQLGDLVVTHTGRIEPVTAIVQTQEHSQLYHIRWNGDKQGLALSYEHPVLILQREEIYKRSKNGKLVRKPLHEVRKIAPAFVPASEIKSGDYVLEIIDKTELNTDWDEDLAFLMGVYAAKGYVSNGFVEFCFGSNDPLIPITIQKLQKCTNGNIRKIDRTAERNGYYVRVYDNDFASLCLTSFGTGSHNKRPSLQVERLPIHLQKILVSAYIDGDGCLVKERKLKSGCSSGKGAVQISSASIALLQGFRRILLRLGIQSTLSSHERVASSSTVMDNSKQFIEHMLYISNSCHDVLKTNSIKIGAADPPDHTKSDSFFFDRYIAHRVKDVVVMTNAEPTYYLQIGEGDDETSDHSYILNNIATHNCQVAYSICSICHNRAETPETYCSHIRERKTRSISGREKCAYHKNGSEQECPICKCKKGESKELIFKDAKVFEYNYGIKFIENSFVVNPACHECGVTEVIDPQRFRKKVADINSRLPQLLKAAAYYPIMCTDQKCIKLAGQKEIEQLQSALNSLTDVSQSMLKQKDQIDLEFLSDLVTVLADLQTVTDELTQQGYGRLPSPGEAGQNDAPTTGTPGQPGAPGAPTTPVNPTPGGGSKIQTGPAGEVGTVTSPTAARKIDLKFGGMWRPIRKKSTEAVRKASRDFSLIFKMG